MTLVELIAALEQAQEPSRELDFWCWWWGKAARSGTGSPHVDYVDAQKRKGDAPRYTSSIDAALTLVPERCLTGIRELWDSDGKAAAATVSRYTAPPNMMWDWEWHGFAPTPAIALCIAALKARAT